MSISCVCNLLDCMTPVISFTGNTMPLDNFIQSNKVRLKHKSTLVCPAIGDRQIVFIPIKLKTRVVAFCGSVSEYTVSMAPVRVPHVLLTVTETPVSPSHPGLLVRSSTRNLHCLAHNKRPVKSNSDKIIRIFFVKTQFRLKIGTNISK